MNLDNISKKIILTLLIIFVFSYSPQEPEAISGASLLGVPIGGRISYYFPACTAPPAINFVTIQPVGGIGSGPWMFIPGSSFEYNWTPPLHPGQPILGKASYAYFPCLVPCPTGLCPFGPGGLSVIYTGTGI